MYHLQVVAIVKHHSDSGYERKPHRSDCTKVEGYNLGKHCTVGQKTYLKSSTGLRPIPGDLCTNPDKFVTYSNATCIGYDYDAGVDSTDKSSNEGNQSKVQFQHSCFYN